MLRAAPIILFIIQKQSFFGTKDIETSAFSLRPHPESFYNNSAGQKIKERNTNVEEIRLNKYLSEAAYARAGRRTD